MNFGHNRLDDFAIHRDSQSPRFLLLDNNLLDFELATPDDDRLIGITTVEFLSGIQVICANCSSEFNQSQLVSFRNNLIYGDLPFIPGIAFLDIAYNNLSGKATFSSLFCVSNYNKK